MMAIKRETDLDIELLCDNCDVILNDKQKYHSSSNNSINQLFRFSLSFYPVNIQAMAAKIKLLNT
jgi:hypothetical protein